jgi:predicted glutamine amidotransferase
MCRLLGMVSGRERELSYYLVDARNALREQGPKHPHGWGIAAFREGAWTLTRAPKAAHEDEQFVRDARDARGETFVAHIRNASRGDHTLVNTHPFLRHGWTFAHNGTVLNDAELRPGIAPDLRPLGETDSEALFCLILTALQQLCDNFPAASPKAVCRCLADIVPHVQSQAGTGILLSDGARIYFYRNGKPLKWLRPDSAGPPMLVLASEEIGDEEWTDLPDGDGGFVDRSLEIRLWADVIGDRK